MLEKIIPLLLLFCCGIFLKKQGIISKKDGKLFGQLLSKLIIPALIIKSLMTVKFTFELIFLPLSAWFVLFFLFIFAYLFAHLLQLETQKRGAFITAFPTWEGGAIAFPLMFLTFGDFGLSRMILFDLSQVITLFIFIPFLATTFNLENKVNLPIFLQQILKNPVIYAVLIGIFLNIIGFNSPIILNFLTMISNSFLLLLFLMLSLEFNLNLRDLKLASLTIFLKTAIGLILGLIISNILGLSGIEKTAVLVGSSLPPSLITLVFTEENNLDTAFLANLISLSLPIALIFSSWLIEIL